MTQLPKETQEVQEVINPKNRIKFGNETEFVTDKLKKIVFGSISPGKYTVSR